MSSTTAVLSTQSPAEIDGQLFPIYGRLEAAEARFRDLRDRRDGLVAEIEEAEEAGLNPSYNKGFVLPAWETELTNREAAVEAITAEVAPFEQEFARRGGWQRYIVVPGGHLHYSSCHTLTPGRTLAGAVAEASGLNQSEVVGKFGEHACTHCFPDAPVTAPKTPEQEGFCKGSGRVLSPEALDKIDWKRRRRVSIRCSDCGKGVSLTERGALRKHKAPPK